MAPRVSRPLEPFVFFISFMRDVCTSRQRSVLLSQVTGRGSRSVSRAKVVSKCGQRLDLQARGRKRFASGEHHFSGKIDKLKGTLAS